MYKQLTETRLEQEKSWQERKKTIAEQEIKYTDFKQKVAEFPTELEAKKKKGKEEGI